MRNRVTALLLLAIAVPSFTAFPVYAIGAPIGARIENVANWLKGQMMTDHDVTGFVHGTGTDSASTRIFVTDNSFAALAFMGHREVTNSERFDAELRAAVAFLLSSQTTRRDFYQYWDSVTDTWGKSGRLYAWNSQVIMSLGYVAYRMAELFPSEESYWLSVGRAAERTIDAWIAASMDTSGAWRFYPENGTKTLRIDDNGALLVGLSYLALLEYRFGTKSKGEKLTTYMQSSADWLVSRQEKNATSWGFGGLYDDTSRTSQEFAANCLAMFGINSYYKSIGWLVSNPSPSPASLRPVMVDWMEGYVASMVDTTWGPMSKRSVDGSVPHPKLAWTSGCLMRAAADIWINIGAYQYQEQTGQMYEWLTGRNELKLDLQAAVNRLGQSGGFIQGISKEGPVNTTDAYTSASAMFGMLQGNLISIPEFDGHSSMSVMAIVAFSIVLGLGLSRRRRSQIAARPE